MQPHDTLSAPVVKTCSKCGETKPATTEYFARRKAGKDGLQSRCKLCQKAYRVANAEYITERRRANADRNTHYARAYRITRKELVAKSKRERYLANRDTVIRRVRKYYAANKEQFAEYNRKYRLNNKGVIRAIAQNRRARERNAAGKHTAADVATQYKAQKGKCYYCGAKVGNSYHVDHVIPLSRGGSNGPENIVIACRICNESKHNKLPHEWPQGGRLL